MLIDRSEPEMLKGLRVRASRQRTEPLGAAAKRLLDADTCATRADAARRLGVSRAAITQALRVTADPRALGTTMRCPCPLVLMLLEA